HFGEGTSADVALLGAAQFGVANAVPSIVPAAWPEQVRLVRAELDARAARLTELDRGFSRTGAAATALRDHDVARLQIIFGAPFPVAACLKTAFAGTLTALFARSNTLLANRSLEPLTWLTRAARVRSGAARLAE